MSEKRRLSNVSSGLPTVRQVFILSAFVTVFAVTVGVWHFGVSGSRTARTYAAETTERSLIRTGTLGVVWSDPLPGSNEKGKVEYFLHDEKGERQSLVLDQTVIEKAGGIYRLQGKRVTLRGEESPTESKDAFGKTAFGANSIELIEQIVGEEQPESTQSMTGNKKFVNLLCRFSDTVNVPKPASYFEQMFVSTYPGLDHYWRELSYNQMNIDGTVTIGWLDLPHPYSHYYSGGIFNTIAFNQDCGQAAEPLVYFPDFYGINFMGSDNITPGWGGIGSSSYPFSFDGVTRLYGVTWIPPIGYNHQSVVAHEMGHSLGLPHSSGGYGTDYDSKWDVMSSTYGLVQSPPFRDIGQHTISHHKDLLGWIPYGRTFNAPVNGANAINLAPLSTTSLSTRNHLMAKIPLRQNGGDYYTVEVRNLTGYDQSVPAKAVVLHKVSGGGNATVVDIDNNNDPNDAAAQWLPGEVFNDSVNRIRVTINSETFGSFNVTIERNVDCTFSLNPASASFPALGGNGQVEVITQSGCYWELSGAGTYRDFATGETLQIYDAPFVPPYVGLAEDYPSTVTVSGISGTVSKLRLRIYRMTHTAPGDVDMILIAPNGTSSMIMSDAGANTDINGSEFVFDQFAGKPLDEWDHNPSGTYLPTDYDHGDDIFPAPGPGTGSFKLGLDRFNNLNPNGEWKLFVVDDTNGESGYLARGWALEVTDQPVLAETFSGTGSATINYAVTRNYGAARQLTLNIGGQNFIISQGGV